MPEIKYDPLKKARETQKLHEDIIDIYEQYEGTASTKEVHDELEITYKYKHSIKTTENYLKAIKAGAVQGVKLTWVNRSKHILKDFRELDEKEFMEDLQKAASDHQKKLESKNVMFAEQQAYMRLAMESIKDLDTLSSRHHRDIEKTLGLSGIESPYFIDSEDMESVNMSDADILQLKEAIRKDAITEFKYAGKSRKDWYVVEPYKLIIFDGLWYLFGKDTNDEKTPYKTWRLIYIKDVNYAEDGSLTHNMKDEYTESILENVDDANFVVDITQKIPTIIQNITVKLRIAAEIVKQFDHKAHMPGDISDPIMENDGSLIIITKVNTLSDVNAEIKSWFPHIEILEPLEYREDFLMEIEKYRDNFKDEIARIKGK